ncbi:MAG: UDP-N-acetylglucosamine 1-carboxyvinyltransferase [Alphaproteobacteria bacterium]|nr:UDP-N-acetylglucosamine 1-carboxyvinyltransferase [Alphaproteobacteria bacterium]
MGKFRIQGGTPLCGTVSISGAKNSVLELMSAALLTSEEVILENVPELSDIAVMSSLLETLGAKVEWDKAAGMLKINAAGITSLKAPYEIVSKMRASIYVLGALLGRFGEAEVSMPGGCVFGSRPLDVHFRAFETLGATIENQHGYIVAKAPVGGLIGAEINGLVRIQDGIEITTHGGNVNMIEAAVLARGRTVITHASLEPEVGDLIDMLNAMGAKIRRAMRGEVNVIEIDGVESLRGVRYRVMPDRLEAATYLLGAAITGGRVEVVGADASKMGALLEALRKAGVKIEVLDSGTRIVADARGADLVGVDVHVVPYPGFPTDVGSIFIALMSLARGRSKFHDSIYERLMIVPELERMGAIINVANPHTAIVEGVVGLSGAEVKATDLRSGAALTLAGIAADGETVVHKTNHVFRGYHKFVENLRALGANITLEADD